VRELVQDGAEIILTVSASPWEQGKIQLREAMLRDAARRNRVPIVFVNLVGGNDELIFDGTSIVVDREGRIVHRAASFEEDFAVVDPFEEGPPEVGPLPERIELLERALVLGIRDYLHKLGLETAVVGLSGGVDSAVTAHLAARALGADRVAGLLMPGPYSSEHSITDARDLVENLGIEGRTVRIDSIYKSFTAEFAGLFGSASSYGVTQENLQARIRGTLLMAVSNFEGRIVLATGNKSELSVGYTTLYGDLVGGLAVIGDVLKRDVYRLGRHANHDAERIPESTLSKPPSAELSPGQLDTDSLPAYDVLDPILEQALEQGVPAEAIAPPPAADRNTVGWVLRQIDRNEYKRRQAPVVLRVSPKAFGSGRRLPIVHRSGWGV
jgi:NAD+ synthetase